jgi:hypothetical protein
VNLVDVVRGIGSALNRSTKDLSRSGLGEAVDKCNSPYRDYTILVEDIVKSSMSIPTSNTT